MGRPRPRNHRAGGGRFGVDARGDGRPVVDRALQRGFARCRVDPRRLAVGGFSSGAGMALWLGLTNGDLFRGVIALSGGGSLPDERVGKPHIFVAHGMGIRSFRSPSVATRSCADCGMMAVIA